MRAVPFPIAAKRYRDIPANVSRDRGQSTDFTLQRKSGNVERVYVRVSV